MTSNEEEKKGDVRLVFDKSECAECKGLGVVKSKDDGKSYVTCEPCKGRGYIVSYKLKEIGWFNKF